MPQPANGWPPPLGSHLETHAAPVGRASDSPAARYRIATPSCGSAITVPLGRLRQLARLNQQTGEPVWVRCGRSFALSKGGRGCDADRAFDPVFAADGTLTAVRWRPPRRAG